MKPEVREKIEAFLKEQGLRMTSQREIIVEAAFDGSEHYTAEELIDRCKRRSSNASRATVYRTLQLLVESGLLVEIDLGRDVKHYDPNFIDHPHHNHLICVDCDKVVEFEDKGLEVLEDCISRRLGFQPASKSIRIEANCQELQRSGVCKSRKKKAPISSG